MTVLPEGASVGDRCNMVFSGCSVSTGTATAVVTATGMDTEMGKIAHLLDNAKSDLTPLQVRLSKLGTYLGIMAVAACAVIFGVGVASGIPALEIFMTSVSLAVSAIPEGLPAIVTIVLAMGVERMANRNALIRRLPAVETLGSASVICTDKTGTLTQNRMTLNSALYRQRTKNSFFPVGTHSTLPQSAKTLLLICRTVAVMPPLSIVNSVKNRSEIRPKLLFWQQRNKAGRGQRSLVRGISAPCRNPV